MSSLIVASDLDLMMLEISIEQLTAPRATEFDNALLKKTVAMFRLLDKDWTSIYPQRIDYQPYRGSNLELEPFNGGVSVVFPIPESSLDAKMERIDLQLHVRREISKYFELRQSSEVVGIACIDVSGLFNGVIDDLRGKKKREKPVARSSKNTYALVKEDGTESGAQVTVYLRLSHLGHSLISEIEVPDDPKILFYAREETTDCLPYQLREITLDELTGGCWGSETLLPPRNPADTICCCCDSRDGSKALQLGGIKKSSETEDPESADGQKNGGSKKGAKKSSGSDHRGAKNGLPGQGKGKGDGNGTGNETGNETGNGNGNGGEETDLGEDDGSHGAVSCQIKPALCGREGTCNKKDKKGKLGKCGKPDGEGGNPLACGERRKCARRKLAAGSATVGIVDKKTVPCPPPRPQNVCRCPAPVQRTCPSPWPGVPCPTTSGTPSCSTCQSISYYGSTTGPQKFCLQNWESPGYSMYQANPQCRPIMHLG